MRGVWAVVLVLLLVPGLSGCLSFLKDEKKAPKDTDPADVGYDPATLRITGTKRTPVTITSFDGTQLAAVVYEPITQDLTPDGKAPTWGAVVFLHGWGILKEEFEGAVGTASGQGAPIPPEVSGGLADNGAPYSVNRLEAFARAGLVALAYDARGFGQSGGMATVAGPAEAADLDAVLDELTANYPVNGNFGLVGVSYGAGQSYNALVANPRVTTVVPMYGWVDLYEGLATGNVPKAEWVALLTSVGAAGSHARLDPIVYDWLQKVPTRTDLETVKAQMALRSSLERLADVDKPLFICQGLQETLFPQADLAWSQSGGFTRAYIFTGGHGSDDAGCWDRSLTWFRHFLGGFAGGVAGWPALTTVGVEDDGSLDYATFPQSEWTTYHPRDDALAALPHDGTFTVEQRLLSNPLNEPSGVWDQLGLPTNGIPEQMRQDPTALFFEATFTQGEVLLGAPEFHVELAEGTAAPFQLTGILFKVDATGKSLILTRSAYAAVTDDDIDNGTVTMRFHWTKADFGPGDKLVLRVGANDESWWMPYPANYAVDFTGRSSLQMPFFEG